MMVHRLLILVLLFIIVSAALAVTAPRDKVVRNGKRLILNGSPFRMVGFNMWPAAINTWNPPKCGHATLNAGTQLSDWLKAIRKSAPHATVIRTWFFEMFALNNGKRDWSAFDKVLSVCKSYNFRVVVALEDHWGYERTGGHLPELSQSWYNGGYKTQVLPKESIPYRKWVAEVVQHYAGNKQIAAWELVNEPKLITYGFVSDVSRLIKKYDKYTPVGCGESIGPLSKDIYAIPTVDFASYHYYTRYGQTHWQAVQKAATVAGKPWYLGEIGWPYKNSAAVSQSDRALGFKKMGKSIFSYSNCVGMIAWQFTINNNVGDDFNINPGDPALKVIDSFAL
jgi:hypothetical protein